MAVVHGVGMGPGPEPYTPGDSPLDYIRKLPNRSVYIDDWGEHIVSTRHGVTSYVDRVGVHRWATGPMEGERVTQSQRDYAKAQYMDSARARYHAVKGTRNAAARQSYQRAAGTLTVHPAPGKVKVPPWWQHWTTVRWARAVWGWVQDRFKIPEIPATPERTDQPYLDAMAEIEADLLKGGPCTTTTELPSSAPTTPTLSHNLTTLLNVLQECPSWRTDTLGTSCRWAESPLIVIKSRSRGWGSTSGAETPPSKPVSLAQTFDRTDMPSLTRLQKLSALGSGNPIGALFSQMQGTSLSPPGGTRSQGIASNAEPMFSALARSLGQ